MMETVFKILLGIAIIVQLILFVALLRTGWRKDRLKQARVSLWSPVVFFAEVMLIIANPATSKTSRIILLVAAAFAALSIIFNVRLLKRQLHDNTMRR